MTAGRIVERPGNRNRCSRSLIYYLISGPHVMIIVPDASSLDDLPSDPNSGGPWVMFQGTPYAHIMMPVGDC